jgi:DNA processing protein
LKEEELLAVLRLQNTKSVGDILAKKLIATVGSAEGVFAEKKHLLQKINGIGSYAIQHLLDESNLRNAQKELQFINKNNIQYCYFLEENYPKNLQHCIDAPILLFQDGNIDLSQERILSVVGTRNMTRYGREFCEELLESLVPYNPIIVSGFAYGVDICAHKAAMKHNLQTIAVLAHGLEQIYPKAHKRYIHQVNEHGGFFTEFFHDETPLRENFLKRNRIVAGLSQATIIIESAAKGGSLVTADIANSYDREVFAVPGKVTDVMSQGCNQLIKNHKAQLLQSAEDLIQFLNWDVQQKIKKPLQKQLFIELNSEEEKIFNYLSENGQQLLDLIALETEIPVYQLASILLQLELKGVIKPLPGKVFELV